MRIHTTDIRVRYAETDKMGVAHHSSYLLWFELARTGLLREAGHGYREMERSGVLLPVLEYSCRFLKGAEYDDEVLVRTSVTELRSRTITFRYHAYRGDELLAEGMTRHVCVTAANSPRRIPGEVVAAVEPYLQKDQDA